jgi:membrane protein DedA with SNARE-associated domain
MAQWFEQAGEFIQQLVAAIGYPGIFLAAFIEAIFPPLPSELVMPFSGFQVARGDLNFWGAVLASTLGAVVGAIPMYYLGRWADAHIIRRFLRRYGRIIGISEAELDRVMRVFSKYGEAVVFFGRLLPLIRTLISIPAGMNRMPLPRFLLFTAAGTFLWMSALTYAGVVLGENWEQVLVFIDRYQGVLVVVGLGLLLGFMALVVRRRVRPS